MDPPIAFPSEWFPTFGTFWKQNDEKAPKKKRNRKLKLLTNELNVVKHEVEFETFQHSS